MTQPKPERLAELVASLQSAIATLQTPLTDNTRQLARMREEIKALTTIVKTYDARLAQLERTITLLTKEAGNVTQDVS